MRSLFLSLSPSLEVHCSRCLWTFSIMVHLPPFCLIWHLPTVCIMLWVFFQLFMNIRALSHLCVGASTPCPSPSPSPLYLLSRFSTCSPPTPILADKQTNSFFWSRVVSWCCLFSQLTARTHTHKDTDAQTQTCSYQSNTRYSEGSAADTNKNPPEPFSVE